MSDEFIREVDEDYRRERLAELWRRYSGLVIAILVLVVAGVGGWRYWQYTELRKAETASSRFEEALRQSRDGKADASETVLRGLIPDAPAGYRLLARFRLAAETGRGDVAAGAKAYDELADDANLDADLRDLARLRSVALRLDTAPAGSLDRDLERLASPTGAWRHTAREMLGLSALKRGDTEAAGRWFDQIAADRDTPQALRQRLEIYTALVAGGVVETKS